jgi:AcrR family transcriptional regulator
MSFNEKQLHIINIAEKLFASRGYDGTSVRDIAEEAGVNLAMISYYFGSKEKLMQALFEQRTSDLITRVEDLLQQETFTPFQKMAILVDDYVERIVSRQQFHKIMQQEQMLKKNEGINTLLREVKKNNARVIEKLVVEGQKKGAFRKDVDVVLMMNTIIGICLQTFISQDFYKFYNNLDDMPQEAFYEQLKTRLSRHIKTLLKAILVYE